LDWLCKESTWSTKRLDHTADTVHSLYHERFLCSLTFNHKSFNSKHQDSVNLPNLVGDVSLGHLSAAFFPANLDQNSYLPFHPPISEGTYNAFQAQTVSILDGCTRHRRMFCGISLLDAGRRLTAVNFFRAQVPVLKDGNFQDCLVLLLLNYICHRGNTLIPGSPCHAPFPPGFSGYDTCPWLSTTSPLR
jgi:hypothetical protein